MTDLDFLYGSLPRPPDLRSTVACMWFLNSFSKHITSGYLSVDDDVAIWRLSECRCVAREMEIWLEIFQQNLEYGIDDGWLVLLLQHLVFTFRTYVQLVLRECNKDCLILLCDLCKFTKFRFFIESSTVYCGVVHALCIDSADGFQDQDFSRQGENLKFAIDISNLDLCEANYYGFLYLDSLVCDIDVKIFMNFGGLQVIDPLDDGSFDGLSATLIAALVQHSSLFVKSEACRFEALLILVIERLIQFHSCVEAHLRRMEQGSSLIEQRSSLIERLLPFHSCVEAQMRRMEWSSPASGLPWTLAKGQDTFTPISSVLPKAMVHDPDNLELWLKVDGETRQKGLTKDMIFKVPYLISYISSILTLYEGDVILTEGVGPVKIGQKITAGITGLSEVQFDVDRRVMPLS
ncbi:hypothetical protein EUTSA_v10026938mg [Eutrema salsugineum]|uniref:Fumarylacetoacetase-like C-terminal domain-containing protein n=1 Tax=Eutrema salsugineum TaxID=72664 RepID=V4P8U9_EUTSA|nr:hypothetical protein EUTSA_v10026938mg [Eutrema salsugineum]